MTTHSAPRTCSLWYCNETHYALGFCMAHYQNLRRHGDVIAPTEPVQLTMRDTCEEMSALVIKVGEKMANEFCPVCGGVPGGYHVEGCSMEELLMLAMQVSSTRGEMVEEA